MENRLLKQQLVEKSSNEHPESLNIQIGSTLSQIEYFVIMKTIEHAKGNREIAAQILGIDVETLITKIDDKDNFEF